MSDPSLSSEDFFSDSGRIAECIEGVDNYYSRLEGIVSFEANLEGITSLSEIWEETNGWLNLPEKYRGCKKAEIPAEFSSNLERIYRLRELFLKAYGQSLMDIVGRWADYRADFEAWERDEGIDCLEEARSGLDSTARLYERLAKIEPLAERRCTREESNITDYLAFLDEKESIDKRFESIRKEAQKEYRIGRSRGVENRLGRVMEDYNSLSKRHRCMLEQIFSDRSIFECVEQRYHASLLRQQLAEREKYLREGGAVSDQECIASWRKIYQDSLDYLAQENAISMSHIENVNSMPLVDNDFLEMILRDGSQALKAGGLMELDKIFRGQLERELRRIETEFERREKYLGETLTEYDDIADPGEKLNKLEILLGGTDELIKMKKLCNVSLDKVVDFRCSVLGKLNYEKAMLRKTGAESNMAELCADVKRDGDDSLQAEIVRRNVEQLSRIGGSLGEMGVLDEASVRCLFEVRDSCYYSLGSLGIETPVEEIETLVKNINERDLSKIDEFIAGCGSKRTTRKRKQEAESYRKILEVWERFG